MNQKFPQKIDTSIILHFGRYGYSGIRRKTPRNFDRITYSLSVFEVMKGQLKPKRKSPIPSQQFSYTQLVEPISAMTVTIFRNGRNYVRANPYVVTQHDLQFIFKMLWQDAEKHMEMI